MKSQTNELPKDKTSQAYRDLVEQLTDRVWRLWQAELKRDKERRGTRQRRK